MKKLKHFNTYKEFKYQSHDPYWYECVNWYKPFKNTNKWSKKYHKKDIMHHKYREFRTWKHNRKTQWKN